MRYYLVVSTLILSNHKSRVILLLYQYFIPLLHDWPRLTGPGKSPSHPQRHFIRLLILHMIYYRPRAIFQNRRPIVIVGHGLAQKRLGNRTGVYSGGRTFAVWTVAALAGATLVDVGFGFVVDGV